MGLHWFLILDTKDTTRLYIMSESPSKGVLWAGQKEAKKKNSDLAIRRTVQADTIKELCMDTVIDDEILCSVCGRVLWGDRQALGFGKIRHGKDSDCYPGCRTWAENYRVLPKALRHEAGDLLLLHYDSRGTA